MRANVTLPGDLTIEAHTIDISLHGVGCGVPYELRAGQLCAIELDLKENGGGQVELQTIVRSCRQTADGRFEAGLEFVNVPDPIMETLRAILS